VDIIYLVWIVYRDEIWLAYLGTSWRIGLHLDSKYRRLVLPLTYLENHLYSLYNPQLTYGGSFIGQYLQEIIYLDLDEVRPTLELLPLSGLR
jgi:hypothetical protein